MLNNNKTYENSNLRDVQKTFNDGVCEVYEAYERSLIRSKGKFKFSNESIGQSQFYNAYVNGIQVDKAIGIIRNDIIDKQDIIAIDGVFYSINRMQLRTFQKPTWWNVTLSKAHFNYEVADETE